MPRPKAVEHDDDNVELAEPVTPDQRQQLYELRFRGPSPSTATQASAILARLRSAPAGSAEDRAGGVRQSDEA
jgi:hypothetical protein